MTAQPGTNSAQPAGTTARVSIGFVIAILLVAANLRATLTGVGPLLSDIDNSFGLSASWGGLLTTLPLLTFAVTSPFVGRLSHHLGGARLIVVSLATLIIGTLLRSLPSVAALFVGTVVLSAGIACGNVMLPSLIRRGVPHRHIGSVSGLYVTVMGLIAAISSGIAVPLANAVAGGWRTSLAWGLIPAVAALLVWLPRIGRRETAGARGGCDSAPEDHDRAPAAGHVPTPWKSWLAWQVSFFMGLQSLAFYTSLAWLPSILERQGTSETEAGWMLFYYQLLGLVASIVVPRVSRGRYDQRWLAMGVSLITAVAFLLLLVCPGLVFLSCGLLGLGGGSCLVLALTFQSHRAADSGQAAALAGMAQAIGYLVAAVGPLLLGILHDATHDWTASLILMAVACCVMAAAGYGAGRDRHVAFAPR
jgi:CP family cyanate transporter-like MFS transporter